MLTTIIIGGIIASFLYAVTSMKSINFIYRRSKCDSCNENLKWYHLIPVISYLSLRGKCAHCKNRIDHSYPLCELLVIILFVIPLFLDL